MHDPTKDRVDAMRAVANGTDDGFSFLSRYRHSRQFAREVDAARVLRAHEPAELRRMVDGLSAEDDSSAATRGALEASWKAASHGSQAVLVTNAATAAGQYLEAARGDFRTALEMVNKPGEFWERVRSHLRNAERAEREPHGLYVVR